MLNLKGKIIIDDEDYDIEIEGDISSFKFDDQLFVRQNKIQDDGEGQISKSEKNTNNTNDELYTKTQEWTAKEDKILKEQYFIKSVPELIKQYFPNKKPHMIYQRAKELGLRKYAQRGTKKPKVEKSAFTSSETTEHKPLKPDEKPNITIMEDTDWSFEEEEFLRENFFKLGIETIIKDNLLPNKSEDQIRTKAKLMGLILREIEKK